MKPAQENQVVFAKGQLAGSPAPFVVLGISKAAWEFMRHGRTHNFDLTKMGIQLQLTMFGSETRDDVLKTMGLAADGGAVANFQKDYSIQPAGLRERFQEILLPSIAGLDFSRETVAETNAMVDRLLKAVEEHVEEIRDIGNKTGGKPSK